MPKYDLVLQPGETVPQEVAALISRYMPKGTETRLLKHGGRLRISVTSPYMQSSGKGASAAGLDPDLVKEIQIAKGNTEELYAKLGNLRMNQLKQLCNILEVPVRSSARSQELKGHLVSALQSADIWQRIANGGTEGSV